MFRKVAAISTLACLPHVALAEEPWGIVMICNACQVELAATEMTAICELMVDGDEPTFTMLDTDSLRVDHFYCEAGQMLHQQNEQLPELADGLKRYATHWQTMNQKLAQGYVVDKRFPFKKLEEAREYPDALGDSLAYTISQDKVFQAHVEGLGEAIKSFRGQLSVPFFLGIKNDLDPIEFDLTLNDASQLSVMLPPVATPWGHLDLTVTVPGSELPLE